MIGLDQGLIKGQRGLVAWVNFNGIGTVSIRESYNVSSITDNGAGDFTVNFSAQLQDANYAACMTTEAAQSATLVAGVGIVSCSASNIRLLSESSNGANIDFQFYNVAIFR